MITIADIAAISPCEYSEGLGREQFIDPAIRELWPQMPRIAGPAFTVFCPPGDHLMLHAAIYRANPGDIIVVQGDSNYALAGGNVCAIAQKRGVAGMVIDGVIRDLAEVREMAFPVFARGVIPIPAKKKQVAPLNQPIDCGGVRVFPGDYIIADEEGIAVVPKSELESVYAKAKARTDKDAAMTLEQWQENHFANIEAQLAAGGFQDTL